MNKLIIIVFFLLFCIGFTQAQEENKVKIEANVIYGMHGGLALLMDVYQPQNSNGYGILVIPGCGWHRPLSYDAKPLGNPWYLRNVLGTDVLLESGYTIFAIQHRAAPVFRYPAAVEDAQRAVQFMRYNSKRFNIDSTKIGAIGHSSGGHLVSMLGTMDDIQEINSANPINQKSSKVQAVVSLSPVTDLFKFVTEGEGDSGAASSFLGVHFMGYYNRKDPNVTGEYALHTNASPVTHVSADDSPFLIVHGDKDDTVPFSQAEVFEKSLNEANIPTELIVVGDGNHMLRPGNADESIGEAYFEQMLKLFDLHLRNKR